MVLALRRRKPRTHQATQGEETVRLIRNLDGYLLSYRGHEEGERPTVAGLMTCFEEDPLRLAAAAAALMSLRNNYVRMTRAEGGSSKGLRVWLVVSGD